MIVYVIYEYGLLHEVVAVVDSKEKAEKYNSEEYGYDKFVVIWYNK